MSDVKKLQMLAKNYKLLYVEDNDALRLSATKLLKKFFPILYVAADGAEGLELFKKHHPHLVLTDIKMPKLDGMEMAKKIKHARAETKIIVMSAFDEKDYLYKAIEYGIFKFIKKPVSLSILTDALSEAISQIDYEQKKKLFQSHIGNIFNYQSSMIVMLHHTKPIIANQELLDYYGVEDVDELNTKYQDIGSGFLEHDGFLYTDEDGNWINKILADRSKIFNVKMKNDKDEVRHFILKCKDIPDKNNYGILSFDDITDLNLLSLFTKEKSEQDLEGENKRALYDLLSVIKRNNAEVSLYNHYKGVTITNDATILDIKDDAIVCKTTYVQQKVIQFEKRTLLVSETLPFPIKCKTLLHSSFETEAVEFCDLNFTKTSPIKRETMRLEPEENHKITMLIGETKYTGHLTIEDLSLQAVKLHLSMLPAGFEKDTDVTLDMVFSVNHQPLIINTKAKLYKKWDAGHMFEAVFFLNLDGESRKKLVAYITKRQMAIIREFKGLQNGR